MITLGFSCSHDAGVALLDGEQILFASNKERYSRIKFDSGFPFAAITRALEILDGRTVDAVVMDGKMQSPHGDFDRYNILDEPSILAQILASGSLGRIILGTQVGVEIARYAMCATTVGTRMKWARSAKSLVGQKKLKYVDHHVAHAASAALLFNFGPGLVLTLDAIGEGLCSRSMIFDGRSLKPISRIPAYHSLGLLYSATTRLLGFKPGQEGKVTGLAAHGDSAVTTQIFDSLVSTTKSGRSLRNHDLRFGHRSIDILRRKFEGFSDADVAAGVQDHLERSVLKLVTNMRQQHPLLSGRLYVAGGVFANVSLNRRIAEDLQIEVLVAPNMGDGGLGLGAALSIHNAQVDFSSLYLGDDAGNVDSKIVSSAGCGYSLESTHNLAIRTAEDLAAGKVVGVCRGRMEYGPRALGNRSILARADDRSINQWLNSRLSRTEFMPFAPIVRDVDAQEYFILPQRPECYENMTVTCMTTKLAQDTCAAIVHLDQTARPQVVSERRNPWIFQVLTKFKQITGCGVLINTSFNIHEEPIVRTADDAFFSFITAGLDVLITDKQHIRQNATGL